MVQVISSLMMHTRNAVEVEFEGGHREWATKQGTVKDGKNKELLQI